MDDLFLFQSKNGVYTMVRADAPFILWRMALILRGAEGRANQVLRKMTGRQVLLVNPLSLNGLVKQGLVDGMKY